ncbi:DUF3369 domain-containing protein [Aliidiomarina halalkaliphila]|uniref:DUF3369 domain-containing protein n=1 Tax=Aliidiomarina halalkaliphila TaxID=2593535 RepID=A0A552WYY4_9GAMM|nr:DUF3369 domain-containing protein [Aliidiomarina halalkaliphila]TRW48041.1 DUF3369 domain-containing protein [Aliidiomarina halalkaliphila]
MTDQFLFADEPASSTHSEAKEPFHILVVDDDEEIHVITRMALSDFKLDKRPLQFHSAYSGEEAKRMLQERDDFALMLLDVVMESDHAGLEIARWTREVLKNHLVRIVLRTGQPGQAPEEEVIAKYDIDDYKEKTELTYRKLVTLMYSSLRAFRDLQSIERYKSGLERIIKASAEIFCAKSVNQLSQGILEQLVALLTRSDAAAYCKLNLEGYTASGQDDEPFSIIAATGKYQAQVGHILQQKNDQKIIQSLRQRKEHVAYEIHNETYYGLYRTSAKHFYLLYIQGISELSDNDKNLLTLFMNNTAIAFEHAELISQQR